MTRAYEAAGVVYREAGPADDADLRAALSANPLPSWVTMSLRREPSFFAGEGLLGESAAVIAREAASPEKTVGMYTCEFLPVYVDGAAQTVGYLGGLRVNAAYRRRPRVVRHGFASIPVVVGNRGSVPYWFTSVSRENSAALRLLEAGLPGMPVYRRAGEYATWTMSVRRGKISGLLRRARREDADALAAFYNAKAAGRQFAPRLSAEWLLSLDGSKGLTLNDFWLADGGSGVRSCVAIWDQRAFKQTVAAAYRFPLNLLRPSFNAWARATRRTPLPPIGGSLAHVHLAFAAFDDDVSSPLSVVREALARAEEKGATSAVIGLAAGAPLGAAIRARLAPHRYDTVIDVVTWPGEPAPALDGRPVQPEAALL